MSKPKSKNPGLRHRFIGPAFSVIIVLLFGSVGMSSGFRAGNLLSEDLQQSVWLRLIGAILGFLIGAYLGWRFRHRKRWLLFAFIIALALLGLLGHLENIQSPLKKVTIKKGIYAYSFLFFGESKEDGTSRLARRTIGTQEHHLIITAYPSPTQNTCPNDSFTPAFVVHVRSINSDATVCRHPRSGPIDFYLMNVDSSNTWHSLALTDLKGDLSAFDPEIKQVFESFVIKQLKAKF